MNNFLDSLKEIRDSYGPAFQCVMNTGEVKEDNLLFAKKMKEAKGFLPFYEIKDNIRSVSKRYLQDGFFDYMTTDLSLGLVYNHGDVDEEQRVRAGAKPMRDIVRYQTGSMTSYTDGKQTNDTDWGRYYNCEGYISFKQLMSSIKKSGLAYTGPQTFDEFKQRILSGETFDISLIADIRPKNDKNDNNHFVK